MTGRPLTIIGAILAVLALGAFLLFGRPPSGPSTSQTTSSGTRSVVVAANDIGLRVPITLADLKIVKMPVDSAPPESFEKVEQLKGLIPVANILNGQAVTANLVVSSDDQLTSVQAAFLPIPTGFVAFTIPTSEQQGVGNFIGPGDYISVIAILSAGGKFQNSRTVYTNIHVIKVGPATPADLQPVTTKPTPGAAAPTAPPTTRSSSSLTVVVTQCQAEFINWFIANGTIKYTLESHSDYRPQDAKPDPACASVDAGHGVTTADIRSKFPELLVTT